MLRLLAWIVLLLGQPALAQLGAATPHIRVDMVAESRQPAAGGTTTLALRWRPARGWHGYWKNPGDSGVETQARWALPAGVSAGPLLYPVPTTLMLAGLMNHVYESPYAHLVTIRIPAGLATGTRLPIRLALDWLECSAEVCVPARTTLSAELTVGDGRADPAVAAAFAGWRRSLPRPLDAPASWAVRDGTFRMAVPLPAGVAVSQAHFFPLTDGVVDYAAPQSITRNGDRLVIEAKAGPNPAAGPVEGVLRFGPDAGLSLTARPGPVPAAGAAIAATPGDSEATGGRAILLALGGAMLGGLLLNVMPCVFPILSLKALSLARGGGEERQVRREALAYAAGVVLVCLALGAALLGLRAAGLAAGWAFQLQDPRVVAVLLVLVVAIALNLAGLFELGAVTGGGALADRGGVAGAFWTGALAAFVATPCTGPFMAGALGAALLLPGWAALGIFAGLGLGLALPFLLLGFVPALRRRLPRPGPWMATLRRWLAVPMFLTALGLAWVLGQQAGADGMALGLAAALMAGLALWLVGRAQAGGRRRAWWPMIPALGLTAAATAAIPLASAPAAAAPTALGAEPFSDARLAALQAEGRPVFAYFTADWCLTCKVNEKVAIERAEVAAAFTKAGVAVLVGDWTRGDPAIGRTLEAHGRSGVPLYLWYAPGRPGELLPQVLTPAMLIARASHKEIAS